ncbi:MAG: alpha/beta hydrolase [Ardenticatenaceae bacterium]|nr:alpha/beta hydrolase [Ardenticatenaceae bacterium]
MSTLDKVDPEIIPILEMIPPNFINLHDIPGTRTFAAQMLEAMKSQMPLVEGVSSEDRHVPGPEGDPDVMVRIYWPENRPETLPGLLWIHGGGYVLGDVEGDDAASRQLAKDIECVVVSVEYRLAPEHPHPAPVEDCYAALKWFFAHAGELGVDANRIAIGGGSAGGGLAAGLALLARDRGEVNVCFQLLVYPMLDDRSITPSAQVEDTPIWTRESNIIGWRSYLGQEGGGEGVSPYAAAARATDLTGLPPAFIPVGDVDLFLDEDIEYARRLMAAGVPTELHVYPGAIHGFDGLAPMSAVAQRFIANRNGILRKALHG